MNWLVSLKITWNGIYSAYYNVWYFRLGSVWFVKVGTLLLLWCIFIVLVVLLLFSDFEQSITSTICSTTTILFYSILFYYIFKSLRLARFFVFERSLICSPWRLHLLQYKQWHCEILQFKISFLIVIYFNMQFIPVMAKLNFQRSLLKSSVSRFFSNYSNMLIHHSWK